MTDTKNKPSMTFWIIGVLALVWYGTGVKAYIDQAYMTIEDLSSRPEAEQLFYNNLPAWVTAAFALSVFSGLLGCVGLLMQKKWANLLFLLSLLAVIAQFVHNVIIQDFMEVTTQQMIWSFVVVIIAVFLLWYSKNAIGKGWLA
jgi:hypothetical protein